jgi:hypothetical protein
LQPDARLSANAGYATPRSWVNSCRWLSFRVGVRLEGAPGDVSRQTSTTLARLGRTCLLYPRNGATARGCSCEEQDRPPGAGEARAGSAGWGMRLRGAEGARVECRPGGWDAVKARQAVSPRPERSPCTRPPAGRMSRTRSMPARIARQTEDACLATRRSIFQSGCSEFLTRLRASTTRSASPTLSFIWSSHKLWRSVLMKRVPRRPAGVRGRAAPDAQPLARRGPAAGAPRHPGRHQERRRDRDCRSLATRPRARTCEPL